MKEDQQHPPPPGTTAEEKQILPWPFPQPEPHQGVHHISPTSISTSQPAWAPDFKHNRCNQIIEVLFSLHCSPEEQKYILK